MAAPQPHPRPAAMLAFLSLLQAVCWSLAPALVFTAIPLDIAENSAFGAEHVLVAYKNPALTGLLLEGLRLLKGEPGWPAYVLSQVCVVSCIWIVYALGRDVLGASRAAIGAAVLLACYYFNWHTPEFNHDILQMPMWAAVVFCLWKAIEQGTLGYWIMLGLTAALSLYGKLSAALLLITCALWLLSNHKARATITSPGPWAALAIFCLAVAPLAYELFAHGAYGVVSGYATMRGRKFGMPLYRWVLLLAAMVAPMALVLWATVATQRARDAEIITPQEQDFRRFLLFFTLVPIALSIGLASLHGAGAKLMWGVPMLNLTGLLLVSYGVPSVTPGSLKRFMGVMAGIILAASLSFAAASAFETSLRKKPSRTSWPQEAIAKRMRQIWANETGAPLRIVAGDHDNWVSSLVALTGGPVASILTAGNFGYSPWITPERLRTQGALVVWDASGDEPASGLYAVIDGRAIRFEDFPMPRGRWSARIGYVVVPPQGTGAASAQ